MSSETVVPNDSRLRFNLAVQKSRATVYTLTFLLAVLADAADLLPVALWQAVGLVLAALGSALLASRLYRNGFDLRHGISLNPWWLGCDVLLTTWAVYLTSAGESPWFIWYVAPAGAAAFVSGKKAVYLVGTASTIAYLSVLKFTGNIGFFDHAFMVAAFRMLFLFAASYFFLRGIADLQVKRRLIQQLQLEESRKVDELSRLTEELDLRRRELAEANLRIREADRLKSRFLANMSHELRTPLNSIIGFAEILAERLSGQIEPRFIDFLNHILTSGQHLLRIINDVLDLSKIEAGKMELYPERFSAADSIANVCAIMHSQAEKQKLDLAIEVAPNLPRIEADPAKFKQILYNLLSNAVKFSTPGTRVSIVANHVPEAAGPGSIRVTVIDEGIGITPEDQTIVFEEFRQVDGGTKKNYGGSGLGLALVRKFVEIHHGAVGVESELGKGSHFWFTMPVEFRGDASPTLPEESRSALHPGERVLVVEDDSEAFDAIAGHLESAGYIPIRARHGDEAMRLARLVRPVAITLDLILPGLDGLEVLKSLKGDPQTREIPVVIISMIDNRELGLALGAHDYFLKPVDFSHLIDRLRDITSPGDSTSSRRRLLLIDDDRAFQKMMTGELRQLGYEIEGAFDGAAGIDLAQRSCPDVIILDLTLPGMNGFEVAEALNLDPRTSRIPIVIMTSKELSRTDREQLQQKISGFVPKGKSAKARLLSAIHQVERVT